MYHEIDDPSGTDAFLRHCAQRDDPSAKLPPELMMNEWEPEGYYWDLLNQEVDRNSDTLDPLRDSSTTENAIDIDALNSDEEDE